MLLCRSTQGNEATPGTGASGLDFQYGTNGRTKPPPRLRRGRRYPPIGLEPQAVTEYFGSLAAIFHALTKPLAYAARRTMAPATTARMVPWPYAINSPVLGSSGIVPAAMIKRTGPIISTAASAR